MDKHLLDILVCPASRAPLRLLDRGELRALNDAIGAGTVDNAGGERVVSPLSGGLVTCDLRTIYRIEDDIPVLLAEEGIDTAQLPRFARA